MSHHIEILSNQITHTPEEIQKFLTIEVKKWKAIKNNPNHGLGHVADHYINAFQIMEKYLFEKI